MNINNIYTEIKKATIRSSITQYSWASKSICTNLHGWKCPSTFSISILKFHSYCLAPLHSKIKHNLFITYLLIFIKETFPIPLTPRKIPRKCYDFSTIVGHKILDSGTILNIASTFFKPSCGSEIPSGITSFYLGELPLVLLTEQVYQYEIFSSFFDLKMSSFPFPVWRMLLLDIEFWVNFFPPAM